MSVVNNQPANQTTFNNAFLSRTTDSGTIGKITLSNGDNASVTDVQKELNAIASYTGKSLNSDANDIPAWTINNFGASSDSLFDKVEAIDTFVANLDGNGILYGNLQQTSNLYYSPFSGVGIFTNSPQARLHVNGSFCFSPEDVSASGGNISGFSGTYLRVTAYDSTPVDSFVFLGGERLLLLSNVSGSDITLTSGGNIETGGADITWLDNTLILLNYDSADSVFRVLSGGGGGSTNLYNTTFTGTSITTTADAFQKWRYEGTSEQTLATLDFSAMPDGGRLIITSNASSSNALTLNNSYSNVQMNGEKVLYQYSSIEFIKDGTQLIQVGI